MHALRTPPPARPTRGDVGMASTPKTLDEFFHPAKRLRLLSPSSASLETPTPPGKLSSSHRETLPEPSAPAPASCPALTPEKKRRMDINKALARSRRNLRVCRGRIEMAKVEGLDYVRLEELLAEETWLEALPGELQKPYAQNLCRYVEREVRGSVPIYPPPCLIFYALHLTPFDQVKVVIIGQDPYHGAGQAMGLAFSVPEGVKIPSSLINIFKELQEDLGCSVPLHGNLERWAAQGVLLLNTVLTVRNHQANSHAKKGWEPFTDAIIRTISQKKSGVVFLLWGISAQVKARMIDVSKHHILKAAHPSGLSANKGFFGCRHFSQTNQILEKLGLSPIDWQL